MGGAEGGDQRGRVWTKRRQEAEGPRQRASDSAMFAEVSLSERRLDGPPSVPQLERKRAALGGVVAVRPEYRLVDARARVGSRWPQPEADEFGDNVAAVAPAMTINQHADLGIAQRERAGALGVARTAHKILAAGLVDTAAKRRCKRAGNFGGRHGSHRRFRRMDRTGLLRAQSVCRSPSRRTRQPSPRGRTRRVSVEPSGKWTVMSRVHTVSTTGSAGKDRMVVPPLGADACENGAIRDKCGTVSPHLMPAASVSGAAFSMRTCAPRRSWSGARG